MTGQNKRKIVIAVVGFIVGMLMLSILSRVVASFAVVEVKVATASRNTISEVIKASATTQTRQEVAVSTEAEQTIETFYVTSGDTVASGDMLFKIRTDDLDASIVKLEEDRCLRQQHIELLYKQIEAARVASLAVGQTISGQTSSSQSPSGSTVIDELNYQVSSEVLECDRLDRELSKLYPLRAAEGVICSPVAGTVTEVLSRAGDTTSQNAALLIADASAGTKLVFSVARTKAANITADTVFGVTTVGSKEPVVGIELAGVTQNPLSSEMMDVTLHVPADGAAIGATLSVEITVSSLTYDMCIPLIALHESSSGAYVFVMGEQQTALGAEQVARSVNVTVVGRDSNWAAVEGIGREQLVIVESAKMLTDTDRVLVSK